VRGLAVVGWNTLASIGTAAASLLLVAVGVWGVCETRAALELSQRAWLVPVDANYYPLLKDKPIHFIVWFANTGHDAARDLNSRLLNSTIESYDAAADTAENISVPDNTACEGLLPAKGTGSIPPSTSNIAGGRTFDSIHGELPLSVDDRILRGDKFYVARGCVAYTTFNSVHHSAFCYILQMSGPVQQPATVAMGQPQTVTGQSQVAQAGQSQNAPWTFVPCPRGFLLD
jgi:hypothetical protein